MLLSVLQNYLSSYINININLHLFQEFSIVSTKKQYSLTESPMSWPLLGKNSKMLFHSCVPIEIGIIKGIGRRDFSFIAIITYAHGICCVAGMVAGGLKKGCTVLYYH